MPKDMLELTALHAQGNWDAIEKLAHRIKGGLLYCGTVKLIHACQYLERYRKAGHTILLEPLYQQLRRVETETTIAVKEWLSR